MAETKGSTDRRETFLGSAAYADTKHDFGHGKFKVNNLDIVLNDNRIMYNKGLFGESNENFEPDNFKTEDALLNSLLSEPASPQDSRSSKTLTLDDILTNIIKEGNQKITINVTGKPIQYNVKGIVGKIRSLTMEKNGGANDKNIKSNKLGKFIRDIKLNKQTRSKLKKKKEYISAKYISANELFIKEKFGLENDAALVIDATSVSISTILKTGDDLSNNRIYYVMTPEILNDPAEKTSCKDISDTKKSQRGVNFIPIVEVNSKDRVYNYIAGSNNSFEQFLTTYSFKLSKMGIKQGMKNYSHTTDLTITHENNNVPNITKNQNAIGPLALSLNKIITDKRKNYNDDAIWNMNRRFQQKRSGDWLQVLLCKNVRDRDMGIFTDFKTKPVDKLPEQISKVYFVTHDRVALAFALYSGVDCIFTHGVNLYKFSLDDPLTNKNTAEEILVNERNTLSDNIDKLTEKYNKVDNMLKIYNEYTNAFFRKSEFTIDNNVVINILNGNTVVSDNINEIVHKVFEKAYQDSYYKSLYPDLSNIVDNNDITGITHISNVKKSIEELQQEAPRLTSEYENKPIEDLKELNKNCNKYITIVDNAYKVLSGLVKEIPGNPPSYSVIDYTGKHTAQSSYRIINKWDWKTQTIRARQFTALINSLDTSKTPSCIFLYELQHLSEKWQQFILARFSKIYSEIQSIDKEPAQYNWNDNTGNLDNKSGEQFRYAVKFFCINVFIAMDSNYNKKDIELYIADYFKHTNIVQQGSFAKIMDTVKNLGNVMRSWFITDVQVVTEHNEINKRKRDSNGEPDGNGEPSNKIWLLTGGRMQQSNIYVNAIEGAVENTNALDKNSEKMSSDKTHILTSETTDNSNNDDVDIQISYDEKQVSYRKLGFMLNYPNTTNAVGELYDKKTNQTIQELPFQTYSGCFHPLLPIYVLTEGLYQMTFDHIDETMDYELYLQYFELLNRMRTELEDIYQPNTSDKSIINDRQVRAYFIGLGIRELFINANLLSLETKPNKLSLETKPNKLSLETKPNKLSLETKPNKLYIEEFMDLSLDEYMPIFLLNANIRNVVLGSAEDTNNNISRIVLEYPRFVEFLNEIDIPSIFYSEEDTPIIPIEEFQEKCYNFLIETGEKLITSRLGPYTEAYKQSQMIEEASSMEIGSDEVSTEISPVEASSMDTIQDAEHVASDRPPVAPEFKSVYPVKPFYPFNSPFTNANLVPVAAGGRNYTKSNKKVIRHQTIRKRHK
jgi:hypothetical protein